MPATKSDIQKSENRIMEAIKTFVAKQTAHNDKIDAAVDGLTEDIKTLNDTIEKLQTSPGTITPEDQASLDALEARGDAIAEKLTALDSITPPAVPTV
jgi:predicted  nucleic acid-binding Zn-ribbon protein